MEHPAKPVAEPRWGWVMVAIAPLYLGLGNGGMSATAVFLKPITSDLGWLRGETSLAYLAGSLGLGAGGILWGHLADRYGTRHVVIIGVLNLALVYLLLSRTQALWHLYVLYILMGGIGAAALFAPLLANVGGWFQSRKGLALGLATAGQALAQGGLPYLAALLILLQGWRGAYLTIGLAALCLLPATLLIRPPPARPQGAASAEDAEAFPLSPGRSLTVLAVAAVFCCITMATALIHMVALASDQGLAPEAAARVLLVVFATGVAGRIFFGRLADRTGPLPAYLLASFWQTVLVFWFTRLHSPGAFYALAAVWGFGYAGVMTCLVFCGQHFVPASRAGVATGIVALCGWLGMGLGGWQGGFFFDLTGDYTQSFANAALAGVVNLSLLTLLLVARVRGQRALQRAAVPA